VLDPITLKLAFEGAKFALNGIRSCCEMLSEGKVEIQRIKKGVEDAKSIAKDVSGLWAFLKSLFDAFIGKPRPDPIVAPVVPDAPAAKKKDEYVDYIPDEDDISEQFFDNLITFMQNQAIILDHIAEQKEHLLNDFNPDQNSRVAAALLIKDERKINQMALEFSALLTSAPRVLGAVYTDFKEKYPVVVEAQERAKERLRITRQHESWRREQAHKEGLALAVGLFLTLLLTVWLWAVWIRLSTTA
jgi:hypothetical protein